MLREKAAFLFLNSSQVWLQFPWDVLKTVQSRGKPGLNWSLQVSLECNSVCLLLGKDNRNRKIKLAFDFLIFCTERSNGTNMLKPCCKMCCCLCIRDKWNMLLIYQHKYKWYQYTLHILWHKVWGGERPWVDLDTDTIVNFVKFVNTIKIQLQMQILPQIWIYTGCPKLSNQQKHILTKTECYWAKLFHRNALGVLDPA